MANIYPIRWLASVAFAIGIAFPSLAQCPIQATCTPGRATNTTFGMGLLNVTIGTINNTTGGATNGYQDYSCTVGTILSPGLTYPVAIQTNASVDETVRVWIDYNNNGAFDPVSELFFSSDFARQHTGTSRPIPTGAVTGQPLRMRVSADAAISSVPTPCSTPQYSQVEDYRVTLQANTRPPITAWGVNTTQACTGSFTFQDQSQQGPATWRWRFGDGGVSTQASPTHSYAASGTYSVTLRTCNANGCDSLTKTVSYYPALAIAPACVPQTTAYCCGYGITQFSLAGQTHPSANASAGYEDFTCQRQFTVQQGVRYSLQVNTGGTVPHHVAVFIDYNNDGAFTGADERVYDADNVVSPGSTIAIAAGGVTGVPLRLRVLADVSGQALSACSNPTLGQAEDYRLVVTPGNCSSLPAVVPPLQGVFEACTGQPGYLQWTNPPAGASFQWQASPDSVVWTSLLGATATDYGTPPLTGVITYYRVRVACGTRVRYSRAYRVAANPALCYCSPNSSPGVCSTTTTLGRVWIPTTTLDLPAWTCTGADSAHHIVPPFPANNTAILQRGATYEINAVGLQAQVGGVLWIDYNHNQQFDFAESVYLNRPVASGQPYTYVLTVPATAPLGLTAVRLRMGMGIYSCHDGSGEVTDFFVTIAPSQCTTPVLAGRVVGSRTYCPGSVPAVSLLYQTPGATLQWQTSPDSLAWTDRAGALARVLGGNAPLRDSLYVRVRVSCGTASVYSPAFYLRPDPQLCFCAPTTTQGSSSIALASFGIGNTPLYVRRTASAPLPAYQYYPPTVPTNTATLLLGLSYPVYLKGFSGQNLYPVTVWVDYNADGHFTQNEATVLRQGFAYAFNDTISALTVPPTARPGVVRMRVMSGQGLLAASTQCGPNVSYLRDFLVTLARPPAPGLPLSAGTVTGAASVCAGQPVRLATAGYSRGSGLQWEQLVGTAWQALATTEDVLYSPPITTSTSFRVRVTAGTSTAVSAPVTVAPTAPCPCTGNLGGFSAMSAGIRAFWLDGAGASVVANTSGTRTASPASSIYGTYGMTDSTHAVVTAGGSCVCTVYTVSGSTTAVWADLNNNGVFEASEYLPTYNLTQARLLTLPVTQPLGPLRLRLRSASTQQIPAGGACTRFTEGETQDYTVTVAGMLPFAPPDITVSGTLGVGGSAQLGTRTALAPNATVLWEGPLGFTSTQAQPSRTNLTAAHSGYYLLTVRSPAGYQLTTARYLPVGTPTAATAGVATRLVGFTLFPNPASGAVTLRIANPLRPFQRVRVLNSTGQVVLSRLLTAREQAEDVALDLTQQARGLYLVQLIGDTGTAARRLMLE